MVQNPEGYWNKHHWAIVQAALALYVAVLATVEFFHPHTPPSTAAQEPSVVHLSGRGVPVTSSYSMPFWLWAGIVALVLSVLIPVTLKLVRDWRSRTSRQVKSSLGIPSLSALLGQDPTVSFNPKIWFAQAYYSPITAEMERNIKEVADHYYPKETETFYIRFIGVGLVSVQHEMTWTLIFRSQLSAMDELSSRGLIPVNDLKKHYSEAAKQNPKFYAGYPFEEWITFMKTRMLIATYPSQMAELSFNGKDFLRYLAHVGYNSSGKNN